MPAKLSQEQFIAECKRVHKGKGYDFSKTVYVHSNEPISFICPDHGNQTLQQARNLKNGHGCPDCGHNNKHPEVNTWGYYLPILKELHKNAYTYENLPLGTRMVKGRKLNAVCNVVKAHGKFTPQLGHHLKGGKCPDCADQSRAIPAEKLILKSKAFHKDAYDYIVTLKHWDKTGRVNTYEEVPVTCKADGSVFWVKMDVHSTRGARCPTCYNEETRIERIRKRLEDVGTIYDFSNVPSSVNEQVTCTCKKCGKSRPIVVYTLLAKNYVPSDRCVFCKLSQEDFINQVKAIWKNTYRLDRVLYDGYENEVILGCKRGHGYFPIKAGYITSDEAGCPKCYTSYSKDSIKWLRSIEEKLGRELQHAESTGEYKLPELGKKIDGYDETTRTVYEYHGYVYHGDPLKYEAFDKCHPYKDVSAFRIYNETRRKEEAIKAAGYNLVVMWESDYRLGKQRARPFLWNPLPTMPKVFRVARRRKP